MEEREGERVLKYLFLNTVSQKEGEGGKGPENANFAIGGSLYISILTEFLPSPYIYIYLYTLQTRTFQQLLCMIIKRPGQTN